MSYTKIHSRLVCKKSILPPSISLFSMPFKFSKNLFIVSQIYTIYVFLNLAYLDKFNIKIIQVILYQSEFAATGT